MVKLRPIPAGLSSFSPTYLAVTWFQSGRIRPASGSWGTLAAFPVCWLIHFYSGVLGLLIFALAIAIIGTMAIKAYGHYSKNPDPSEVVIDEVLGMAITGMLLPFTLKWWVWGFIFFRLFDSIKRGPVGWCDRNIKGPIGVMFDDVVAGLLAGGLLLLLSMALR